MRYYFSVTPVILETNLVIQHPELLCFCIIDSLHWEKFPAISLVVECGRNKLNIYWHSQCLRGGWCSCGRWQREDCFLPIVKRAMAGEREREATKPDQMALKTDAGRGQKSPLTYRNLTECIQKDYCNRALNCSVLIGCQGCVMYGSSCPLCLYLLDSLQQDSS